MVTLTTDVLVIGGGATGAGVAWDVALRRFDAALADVGSERSTTVVLPVVTDVLRWWLRRGIGGDEPTVPSNCHTVTAVGRGDG